MRDLAAKGDTEAMVELASRAQSKGELLEAATWRENAAIAGNARALTTLITQADAKEKYSLMGLCGYYVATGDLTSSMACSYRLALLDPEQALIPALWYLFGDADKLGHKPTALDRKRGMECLIIAAKTETRTRGLYVLLDRMANQGMLPEAEPKDRAIWAEIAGSANDRDWRYVVLTLDTSGCLRAKKFAAQFEAATVP